MSFVQMTPLSNAKLGQRPVFQQKCGRICARRMRMDASKRVRCNTEQNEPKGFGTPDRRNNKNAKSIKQTGEEADSSADALTRSLGELSKVQGRVSRTNNLILGTDNTEENWREIDKKVNEYPGQRVFTAIGTGGAEFEDSMVKVVESYLGPVHMECVTRRESANGKYLSVRVGPVWVNSADQVIEIYTKMREDSRLKWCM